MDPIKDAMTHKSRSAKIEARGHLISLACISLIVAVVLAIFFFVASRGWQHFSPIKSIYGTSYRKALGNQRSKMRTAIRKLALCQ